jgi:pilus assembly protein CpaE
VTSQNITNLMTRYTTLIIDPNPNNRLDTAEAAIRANLELVGEANYGTEASVLAVRERPAVVLLSIEDPPTRAFATLEALQRLMPDTVVIVYSSVNDLAMMRQAMRHGARDYLVRPLQAESLREAIETGMAQEGLRQEGRNSAPELPAARGTIITIHSPKGGVGKTTIATNLALALRSLTGQEVVLVDADVAFGDVALMLDLQVTRGIADLALNEPEIHRGTVIPYLDQHPSGLAVLGTLFGPDGWQAVGPISLTAILSALAEAFEYVVVDTPGSVNELVAAALQTTDLIVLVTSRDVSSVKDARATVGILRSWGISSDRIRLVINDSTHAPAVSSFEVERVVGLTATTTLPYDRQVELALQTGAPVVLEDQRSKFADGVAELAQLISGVSDEPRRRASLLAAIGLGGRRAL